ncbi:Type VI secretion system (T6SS), amidase immunity protein [Andreprevotia lacus DSM 23236]|jgi:hypothetical protein|uniref:Type VI secretion system (T6SS), amidase immunity protein n=1 Tax=Andreprevotia lacus DSM 23236 TaxID=1121001 RepID=A0A1W1X8G4_9NEIS|nr:T6SS amidase immunity protein Tai4 family protein [Andreprevotia lacus]SMC20163.1 Type VI secretion system (T6SS), amidase immunity protein [Andreprevotia lacus DSM 23236]
MKLTPPGSLLAALLLLPALAHAASASAERDYGMPLTDRYSQTELLKNYALAHCIGRITTDPHLQAEAGHAMWAFLDYGNQGLEAYARLRRETARALSVQASGSIPGDFTVNQCIDYYHSKALARLVHRLVYPPRRLRR